LHLCTCTAARPYRVPGTKKISIDGICFETNQIMKMRKNTFFWEIYLRQKIFCDC